MYQMYKYLSLNQIIMDSLQNVNSTKLHLDRFTPRHDMLRNVINLLVTAEDQREHFRAAQLRKQTKQCRSFRLRYYSQIKYT